MISFAWLPSKKIPCSPNYSLLLCISILLFCSSLSHCELSSSFFRVEKNDVILRNENWLCGVDSMDVCVLACNAKDDVCSVNEGFSNVSDELKIVIYHFYIRYFPSQLKNCGRFDGLYHVVRTSVNLFRGKTAIWCGSSLCITHSMGPIRLLVIAAVNYVMCVEYWIAFPLVENGLSRRKIEFELFVCEMRSINLWNSSESYIKSLTHLLDGIFRRS